MRALYLYSFMLVLTTLVGCGDDVGSNRKKGNAGIIQGAEAEGSGSIRSPLARTSSAPVLSYAEEISQTFTGTLSPALYRLIPSMETDDESAALTQSTLGRPVVICGNGTTLTGIDSRITDCFQKNGVNSDWEGVAHASAGEGTWALVAITDGKETWLDRRTGMVWSDLLGEVNWCKASGNTEGPTPTATVNCLTVGESVETCATAPTLNGQIRWRLPTRNDYLQADLDGLRFVLKSENGVGLWTATINSKSVGRTEAWVYESSQGILAPDSLVATHQVRCIGAPIR